MISPHGVHSKHHLRFYIVTATLIIGGILFLLSLNNTSDGFSLTSAIVGISNKSIDLISPDVQKTTETTVDKALKQEAKEKSKTVPMILNFNKIPSVEKKAKIQKISLTFDELTSSVIKLNNDKLELNNLESVALDIEDFKGEVDFDASGLSLNGVATRIEVNGIAFSSEDDIKISFNNLKYQTLVIDELELEDIDFPVGDGSLEVLNKLSYTIAQESLDLYFFSGKLSIDKDSDEITSILLEGEARSIAVSGDLLSLNLR